MPGVGNPLSVPGGWSKDKDSTKDDQNSTTDTQFMPRSAAGIVGDNGQIFDDSGKAIGRIADSKNPQELVGNTVNETGEILSSTGDVLGKALPLGDDNQGEEYTTESGDKKGGPGSQIFSRVGSAGKQVTSGFGMLGSQSKVGDNTQQQDQVHEKETPVKLQDNDPSTEQDNPKGTELQDEIQPDDSISKVGSEQKNDINDVGKEACSSQKDLPEQVDDKKEDLKSNIPEGEKDVPEGEKDIPEDAKDNTEMAKDETESNVQKDIPEDAKDDTEMAKDETESNVQKDILEDAKDDTKTAKDETESNVQKDIPEDVKDDTEMAKDETESNVQKDVPEDAKNAPEDAEKEAEDAKVDVPDVEAPDGDVPADKVGEEEGEKVEEEGEKEAPRDVSALKGTRVNKAGNLVNDNGDVVGRVIEGDVKQLLGKRCDENGDIWNDAGKAVGKGEPLPDAEREDLKDFAPFENFPDATVEADGSVVFEGRRVGTVVEGDPKRLKGSKVDEDGDILDRRGNVVGKAEAWDEPEPEAEPEKVDNSALAGKRVNKAGNVIDKSGEIYGRVIEGAISSLVGRMCDKDGNIRSESGDIIGKAELVSEGEREGLKEGPFAELQGCTVAKDGKVVTPSGDVVGRLVTGDPKVLFGRPVDEDGDILDRNGNSIGKAERWEEAEVEKKKNPLAGRKVNREGNVVDEEGNIVGKLTSGELSICSGKEVDEDGDVVNAKGNTIGHVNLLEDIPEPEPEPEVEEGETEEEKKAREEAEKDRKLAGQLSSCIEQSLDRIRPICKMITEKIESAERKPKEELDEEELVKQVKPLIEEGGRILTETNGSIRGMDPDGRIQRNAKQKAYSRDASPEEYHLAEVLKELTGTVTQCIDSAKSKIADMPHAKKELNPLWGLLAEPLGQILAGVGLLLSGVLGIVGRLLSGLGLGGILDGLLGSLGLKKVLEGLGLGSIVGSLTGKKK